MVFPDHSFNSKHGGIYIYYENCPRIIRVNYLSEYINFEIMIGNKICKSITLYMSLSQNQDHFQALIDNLEMTLETLTQKKSFLTVVISDFNLKSKS